MSAVVAYALLIALLSAAGGIAGWEFVTLTIAFLVVVAVCIRRGSAAARQHRAVTRL